jgi:DNA repair exonuclease SbcCD ATPase subunit
MRLLSLRVRGIGPAFRASEATLDLEKLPGALVAVIGANGAGKSSFLGAWPGALYREIPTRGTLVEMARVAGVRDAFVEAVVETPRRFTIRMTADGISKEGKSEATVLDEAGAPALASSSVRAFDAWAAQHLPSREVFESTLYMAQGSTGWIGLTTAQRKAVVLKALGVERLEVLAERARAHANAARNTIAALEARLREAREKTDAGAEDRLTKARDAAVQCDRDVQAAQVALEQVRATHAAAVAAWKDVEAARARRAAAVKARDDANAAADGLSRRAAQQRHLLADRETVAVAAASIPGRRAAVDESNRRLNETKALVRETTALVATLKKDIAAAESRWTAAEQRRQRAEKAAAGIAVAEAAEAALPEKRAAVESAETAVAAQRERIAGIERAIEGLTGATLDVAGKRIGRLRDGLTDIEDAPADTTSEAFRERASEYLVEDDGTAKDAVEAPAKLNDERAGLTIAKRDLVNLETGPTGVRGAREAVAAAEKVAASLESLRTHAAEANDARDATVVERATLDELRGKLKDEEVRVGLQQHAEKAELETYARAANELTDAERIAARASAIAAAEAALAEIDGQIPAAEQAVRDAETALAKAPEPAAAEPPLDVATEEQLVRDAEERRNAARKAETLAEGAVAAAVEVRSRVSAIEGELAATHEDLADWTRLADEIGQKGLIAHEVDAAGPEWSALSTDLLHAAFGARYSMTITTTREKADGSGVVEVCECRVLDTHDGTDALLEEKSGGQRVFLGIALRLGLLALSCRRSGATRPTLVLDEAGAALDEQSREHFVAMLRRVAQLLDARILLVTHDATTAALCDARVRVADGAVTVD